MIIPLIQDMAKRRGIENASQLIKATGLHAAVAYRLWSGEFQRLDVDTLDRLCDALKCQPNQLLRHEA